MKKLWAIAAGSTLVYAVLAVLMGILPGIDLSQVPAGAGVIPYNPEEMRGREIYVSEGCVYCHTQQVRPLPVDSGFGRPSAPGDFAYQTPELLGSERTGPDLTNIGARQSSQIWQYIHLYEPRAVVPQSIMPAFPWLFQIVATAPAGTMSLPIPKSYAPLNGVVIPTDGARALVAYLLALKQAPLPTAHAAEAPAGPAAAAPPPTASAFNAADGATLYAAHCASCHGAEGAGVTGVFPPLAGDAVVNAVDATEHIDTLLHGLHGKTIDGTPYAAQMPAFAATLSDIEVTDIVDHERSSWGNHSTLVSPSDVMKARVKE